MRSGSPASTAFGVVGGYGATGRVVVSELLRSDAGPILVGGRDAAKLSAVASQCRAKISALRVDVTHPHLLDEFCNRCSVIINCAGPVVRLDDRVAQAALRAGRHYVDAAGMSLIRERMLPHARQIANLGLSFVVSAGWTPGITELLPMHAHARAKSEMEAIECESVYFSDSGEWSENALRDGVLFLRNTGVPKPGYFRRGEWVGAKALEASCKCDLGDPIGLRRFSLMWMPELQKLARGFKDCDFLSYAYLSGFRNAIAAMAIARVPMPEQSSVRLLRGVFHRNRLPVAGFVVVRVVGRSGARNVSFTDRIVFDAGQDYWINGVTMATAARMIYSGAGVQPGVHFLFEAVDPIAFVAALREAGVKHTGTLEVAIADESAVPALDDSSVARH